MKYIYLITVLIFIRCGEAETSNDGDIQFEQGDYNEAVKSYSELLVTDPGNTNFLYNRGRSFEELGLFDKASDDFEKVIKTDPKHANAYLSLSKISYEVKNYGKALLYASSAIKYNENSAKAYFLSARAAHQLGYADQAMEQYNNAISIDREYGEAFLYRGALKIGRKRPKSACEDFKRAKALNVEGADSAISDYCS
ncbi:MAG: tetratricopeptide repeat protein [Cyclobacteriaceae bacterium]